MADYEDVKYDAAPAGFVASPVVAIGKAEEKRYSVHTLFTF
jgi:hypothetical protein